MEEYTESDSNVPIGCVAKHRRLRGFIIIEGESVRQGLREDE